MATSRLWAAEANQHWSKLGENVGGALGVFHSRPLPVAWLKKKDEKKTTTTTMAATEAKKTVRVAKKTVSVAMTTQR